MTHAGNMTDLDLINRGRRKILTPALFGLPVDAVAGSLLYGSSAAHAVISGATVPGNLSDVSSTLTGFGPWIAIRHITRALARPWGSAKANDKDVALA